MMDTTPINLKDIFTQSQINVIKYLFKTYKLKFVQKEFEIKRFDNKMIKITGDCISLFNINKLLEKIKNRFNETKNMNIKFSIKAVEEMKIEIENYLKNQKEKSNV